MRIAVACMKAKHTRWIGRASEREREREREKERERKKDLNDLYQLTLSEHTLVMLYLKFEFVCR